MKINIAQSILAIKNNSKISILNDDINTLEWHDGNPTNITNEQILSKQIELQNAEDNRIATEAAAEQSALNKLKALGLTDAEVKAFRG